MSRARIRQSEPGRLEVEGELVFASVGRLLQDSEPLLAGSGPLVIDLGGVEGSDSAGLALLLEWLDRGRARGRRIRFRGLPDPLRRIARLSNLESLLPVAD